MVDLVREQTQVEQGVGVDDEVQPGRPEVEPAKADFDAEGGQRDGIIQQELQVIGGRHDHQ